MLPLAMSDQAERSIIFGMAHQELSYIQRKPDGAAIRVENDLEGRAWGDSYRALRYAAATRSGMCSPHALGL
jgi:hypothetical protein